MSDSVTESSMPNPVVDMWQKNELLNKQFSLKYAIIIIFFVVLLLLTGMLACSIGSKKSTEKFTPQTDPYVLPRYDNVGPVMTASHLAAAAQVDDRPGNEKVGAAAPGPHKGMIGVKSGFLGSRGVGPSFWGTSTQVGNWYADQGVGDKTLERMRVTIDDDLVSENARV
jgi:hypothetical protein